MPVPPGKPHHLSPEQLLAHIEANLHGCRPDNRNALLTRRKMLLEQLGRPVTPYQPPAARPAEEDEWRAQRQRQLAEQREEQGQSRSNRDSRETETGRRDSQRRR